jgi:hypothetical protein
MFRLKKLHPPFGTCDNPFIEASYSEGAIKVIDGYCEVRLPETRDRLIKLGFIEVTPAESVRNERLAEQTFAKTKRKSRVKSIKKRK